MIKTHYIIALLAASLTLTACASSKPSKTITVNGADALSARTLEPGECGLFVWAGEARRFILYSQAGQGAVLARDGKDVALTAQPSATSGDLYGQIPIQSFTDPDGKPYALSLTSATALDGGTRYDAGTWRHKDSAGWDVLTPVTGLSTCRPVA